MSPGQWNTRTSRSGRHGAFAPIWAVLLAILFYGAQLGPEVLDESIHLTDRATRHPAGAHFEDPGQQSHSDHCLLSQARGEFRALPGLACESGGTASVEVEIIFRRGPDAPPPPSPVVQARAPPVVAA